MIEGVLWKFTGSDLGALEGERERWGMLAFPLRREALRSPFILSRQLCVTHREKTLAARRRALSGTEEYDELGDPRHLSSVFGLSR